MPLSVKGRVGGPGRSHDAAPGTLPEGGGHSFTAERRRKYMTMAKPIRVRAVEPSPSSTRVILATTIPAMRMPRMASPAMMPAAKLTPRLCIFLPFILPFTKKAMMAPMKIGTEMPKGR